MDACNDSLSKILVVSEMGSSGANWASRSQGEMVAIAEQCDELPSAFAERVTRRVARLVQQKWQTNVAVLAVNADISGDACAARLVIARALLAASERGGDAEFVLTGSANHSNAARREMFLLAQTLCEAARGSISVRVDLASPCMAVFGSNGPVLAGRLQPARAATYHLVG